MEVVVVVAGYGGDLSGDEAETARHDPDDAEMMMMTMTRKGKRKRKRKRKWEL